MNKNCINRPKLFKSYTEKYVVKFVLKFGVFKLKIKRFMRKKLQTLTT